MKYLNDNYVITTGNFQEQQPFPYCVIDNFFQTDIADQLGTEFPDYHSGMYNGEYNNPLEVKRTCNIWDRFSPLTYLVFRFLNGNEFLNFVSDITNIKKLNADYGLHGGGLHIHANGGKLNPHLDYSIHPKLKLQRKLNLLVYLNKNWKDTWGGDLGLFSKTESEIVLEKKITPNFNRAIIFDTTENSWHGLARPVNCPDNEYRKSFAVYYLIEPPFELVDTRERALFSLTNEEKNDSKLIELIDRRSKIGIGNVENWDRK